MDPRLFEAACSGDTDELQKLLEEDRFMLERCLLATHSETVLHVAAMAGQAGFVKEILRLKPEVSILNKDGFAAIHLASANGFVEIVGQLLMVNHEHGHLRSRDSRTPLHVATVTGRIGVIRELLSTCPESIGDVTARGETAFHLAVKNNRLEAFKTLMESSLNHSNIRDVLNAKDEDGNTVLHLATARKQGLIVKLILGDGNTAGAAVDANIVNNGGFTALDLLDAVQQFVNEPDDNILRDGLLRSGALRASELIVSSSAATPEVGHKSSITEPPQLQNRQHGFVMKTSFLSPSRFWEASVKKLLQFSGGTKDALMVVVVLMAIFTCQVILLSPGGFHPGQGWVEAAIIASCVLLFIPFIVLKSVGFFTSIAVIILLMNWFPLKRLLRLAMFSIAATYVCCIVFMTVPLTWTLVVKADPVGFVMMARFGGRSRGVSRNETPLGVRIGAVCSVMDNKY